MVGPISNATIRIKTLNSNLADELKEGYPELYKQYKI